MWSSRIGNIYVVLKNISDISNSDPGKNHNFSQIPGNGDKWTVMEQYCASNTWLKSDKWSIDKQGVFLTQEIECKHQFEKQIMFRMWDWQKHTNVKGSSRRRDAYCFCLPLSNTKTGSNPLTTFTHVTHLNVPLKKWHSMVIKERKSENWTLAEEFIIHVRLP